MTGTGAVYIRKLTETFEGGILTASYKCTLKNYYAFLESSNRRQCFNTRVNIGDVINMNLMIYPTGSTREYDDCLSVFIKTGMALYTKLDITVIDELFDTKMMSYSNCFELTYPGAPSGEDEVISGQLCRSDEETFLSNGSLIIVVDIKIHFGMMTPPYLRTMCFRELFRTHGFGDTTIVVDNATFRAESLVLIAGKPSLFVPLLLDNFGNENTIHIPNLSRSQLEAILIECYLRYGEVPVEIDF